MSFQISVDDSILHLLNERKFVQGILMRFVCFTVSIAGKSITLFMFNVCAERSEKHM
jgi:hypothetical protein